MPLTRASFIQTFLEESIGVSALQPLWLTWAKGPISYAQRTKMEMTINCTLSGAEAASFDYVQYWGSYFTIIFTLPAVFYVAASLFASAFKTLHILTFLLTTLYCVFVIHQQRISPILSIFLATEHNVTCVEAEMRNICMDSVAELLFIPLMTWAHFGFAMIRFAIVKCRDVILAWTFALIIVVFAGAFLIFFLWISWNGETFCEHLWNWNETNRHISAVVCGALVLSMTAVEVFLLFLVLERFGQTRRLPRRVILDNIACSDEELQKKAITLMTQLNTLIHTGPFCLFFGYILLVNAWFAIEKYVPISLSKMTSVYIFLYIIVIMLRILESRQIVGRNHYLLAVLMHFRVETPDERTPITIPGTDMRINGNKQARTTRRATEISTVFSTISNEGVQNEGYEMEVRYKHQSAADRRNSRGIHVNNTRAAAYRESAKPEEGQPTTSKPKPKLRRYSQKVDVVVKPMFQEKVTIDPSSLPASLGLDGPSSLDDREVTRVQKLPKSKEKQRSQSVDIVPRPVFKDMHV